MGAPSPFPRGSEVIEVHVAELRQLFHAIDPSPFGDRDLEPTAADFIIGAAREAPRGALLALRVHLDRVTGRSDGGTIVREAVHEFFAKRALSERRRLRELLQRGRVSLAIGLAFLAALLVLADLVAGWLTGTPFANLARESLSIGGWVAMWRPLELFLYDWWPIRAEARLFDRLALMPVEIQHHAEGAAELWRRDRPRAG